jgi:hypothetical protein
VSQVKAKEEDLRCRRVENESRVDKKSVIDVHKETEGFIGGEVDIRMQVNVFQEHSFI